MPAVRATLGCNRRCPASDGWSEVHTGCRCTSLGCNDRCPASDGARCTGCRFTSLGCNHRCPASDGASCTGCTSLGCNHRCPASWLGLGLGLGLGLARCTGCRCTSLGCNRRRTLTDRARCTGCRCTPGRGRMISRTRDYTYYFGYTLLTWRLNSHPALLYCGYSLN